MFHPLWFRIAGASVGGVFGDEGVVRGDCGGDHDEDSLDAEEGAHPEAVGFYAGGREEFGGVEGRHRAEEEGQDADQRGQPGVWHVREPGGGEAEDYGVAWVWFVSLLFYRGIIMDMLLDVRI